jgi:AcrR family transcriptional regulator
VTKGATSTRRIGAEDSATRAALLDAALELMVEEGYAAVTSRRVAARAGLKPQLVHYYFRTMDDLFLALVRRGAERNLERQQRALASDRPLRALWALSSEPGEASVVMELSALANHRKAIRAELAEHATRFRQQQADALSDILASHGIDPPGALFLTTAIPQMLALEEALGLTVGHDSVRAMVEQLLDRLEG